MDLAHQLQGRQLEDAWERTDWYECRWIIEEYHKAQKTGCSIEELQFTSAQACNQ